MSNVVVTNLIGGTVVIHAAYKVSGRSNTVTIPLSYLQEQEGARTSLASLLDSLSVSAVYEGTTTALSSTDITNIGTSSNYWQQSWYQAAIATATMPLDVPLEPCQVTKISATVIGSVLAAGESMTVDVQKIDSTGAAVSILSAPVVVDDTTITTVGAAQSLTSAIDTSLNGINAGQVVQVVLTYVPGGGATGVDFMTTLAFSAID